MPSTEGAFHDMQQRWAALQLRRLRLMRDDAGVEGEAGAASEVQPDASAFGMQHLQPVDGGGGDDSDGSLAPYGQDDNDYTSDDEVGFSMLCTMTMLICRRPCCIHIQCAILQLCASAVLTLLAGSVDELTTTEPQVTLAKWTKHQ